MLPELRPLSYPLVADVLFAALPAAVDSLGWDLQSLDAERREIRAVVTTPLLRFRDDVLIRVIALPGGRSQ